MPYKVTRTGFIITAKDVFGLASFYRANLGFELEAEFDDPPFIILTQAGARLSITADGYSPDDMPGFTFRAEQSNDARNACLIVEVTDCEAAEKDLRAKGVKFKSDLFRPPWGGGRFYIEDPEGNLVEIEELA